MECLAWSHWQSDNSARSFNYANWPLGISSSFAHTHFVIKSLLWDSSILTCCCVCYWNHWYKTVQYLECETCKKASRFKCSSERPSRSWYFSVSPAYWEWVVIQGYGPKARICASRSSPSVARLDCGKNSQPQNTVSVCIVTRNGDHILVLSWFFASWRRQLTVFAFPSHYICGFCVNKLQSKSVWLACVHSSTLPYAYTRSPVHKNLLKYRGTNENELCRTVICKLAWFERFRFCLLSLVAKEKRIASSVCTVSEMECELILFCCLLILFVFYFPLLWSVHISVNPCFQLPYSGGAFLFFWSGTVPILVCSVEILRDSKHCSGPYSSGSGDRLTNFCQ